ncbi:MAG TPA: 2-C-methyl-D-erythritol 4-phosphate cytidylyltransferase [Thermodesulfobacteriota bacterium]|jgi:2-C-methyl-D-erythritol 4-phosphate cytidylyltransferase
MADLKTTAIIAAAGLGKRYGEGIRKQFQLLNGKPLLVHSIDRFEESELIKEIILVVPEDSINYCHREIVERFRFKKIAKIIPGREQRQHSVESGFNSVSSETDVVVIHDGVRPLVTVGLINRVIKECLQSGGAIAAVPMRDTVKKSSARNHIEGTLSRESLWLAQTPQAFKYDLLKTAYEKTANDGFLGTDEASLVEQLGIQIKLVPGSQTNIKITTREDLLLGELLLKDGRKLLEIENYE